ncbi:MAG: tetratricopeptide repeat protein [Mariprofundaceae bacterium]
MSDFKMNISSAQFLRCSNMLRIFISMIVVTLLLTINVNAAPSERIQGARMFLNNGSPEQAIETAQGMLGAVKLREEDRLALLQLIADSEEFRTKVSHYTDVSKAIASFQTLIKEFPDDVDVADLLWKITWLHWQHGDKAEALAMGRDLQSRFSESDGAISSWLMYGRIHILQRKFNEARNDLLQYGVRVEEGSRKNAVGQVWIAMVDHAENRFKPALNAMRQVYKEWPEVIESDSRLFSTFIELLRLQKEFDDALKYAERFLQRYIKGRDLSVVRLLRADLWRVKDELPVATIEKEYSILADQEAETAIGKKAFMRKLMLQNINVKDYYTLKPVVIAMKRIASRNQLSDIELEANLYQAQLWRRLIKSDPEHTPQQALMVAMENYVRVAAEKDAEFSEPALTEGRAIFIQHMQSLLDEESWVKAVVLWERFPTLRPVKFEARDLRYQVAHGLRMLLEYDQAEIILDELYQQAGGRIWGHKVMLERVQVWLERGDQDAINRVMTWLSENEFTLYRPEMLLLAARIQLKSGDASEASQSMVSISPDDVAEELRVDYWETRAGIDEVLSRWTMATHAWEKYRDSLGADTAKGLIRQASSSFKAASYAKAEELYAQVEEEKRDASWNYHYSMCQMNTGKIKQAIERLEALKVDGTAGMFSSLASLALAEQQADELLEAER